MNVEDFKQRLLSLPGETVTTDIMLAGPAVHVGSADQEYIRRRLAETFSTTQADIGLWIVGSAKLGFSITEKRKPHELLPRFRPFRADSDIDVAVISPPIFNSIWADISQHAYRSATRLPWYSGPLGQYLVHGWLRPDHFRSLRLLRCTQWWELCYSLSRETRFSRRAVRGGLFFSFQDLVSYQTRSVTECKQALELAQ